MLADKFEGKRLNAPNDIVVKSDDTIWFTDPLFGINGEWEGKKEKPEQATTNVYRLTKDGKLTAVITDIVNPNGLAFSPDEKKLYVVEWKGTPNRSIWSYDVNADGTLGGKTKLIDAADQGALDGFRSTATAICGAAGAPTARCNPSLRMSAAEKYSSSRASPRISTASWCSAPPASRSPISACRNAAPISPSAARRTTASI